MDAPPSKISSARNFNQLQLESTYSDSTTGLKMGWRTYQPSQFIREPDLTDPQPSPDCLSLAHCPDTPRLHPQPPPPLLLVLLHLLHLLAHLAHLIHLAHQRLPNFTLSSWLQCYHATQVQIKSKEIKLILDSLLTDLLVVPSGPQLNTFIVLKFLLASAHILFEPIVILILR